METKKEAYRITVDVKAQKINVEDENGNILKSYDLCDAVFESVEKRGWDCNGTGIDYI